MRVVGKGTGLSGPSRRSWDSSWFYTVWQGTGERVDGRLVPPSTATTPDGDVIVDDLVA